MKYIKLFEEFSKVKLNKFINTFKIKNNLNPQVWLDNKMKPELRDRLLEIANNVWDELELNFKYEDVVLTGSMANYNYSVYSDFDLHIIIDYSNINKDEELVKKYLDLFKSKWLSQHNIKLLNYDVEIYIQDKNEKHYSTGVYSILNEQWIIKPNRDEFPEEIDYKELQDKSKIFIDTIDKIEKNLNVNNLEEFNIKLKKIWKKIKNGRKAGLEKEGEMSLENLVFKLLRRAGYIEKTLNLINKIYDLEKEKGF